ncbi:DUF1493 family protein [Rahnella sp. ChDrAdgB13]|uniref:DUF1493 family protein n=1 Tax=Rahnella sp. ChDrAdgB13 TaxID=1850581 RepID=UPI001AD89E68|nr:DUF1493 family protein [Rahnella sp. ChDrAdgB13]
MVSDEDVIAWFNARWNKKGKWPVMIDTSLTTGRYVLVWETGEEIIESYVKTYKVDMATFNFLKYWPNEKPMLPQFLVPKPLRGDYPAPEPLTLRMLAESARAGRWLYE